MFSEQSLEVLQDLCTGNLLAALQAHAPLLPIRTEVPFTSQ